MITTYEDANALSDLFEVRPFVTQDNPMCALVAERKSVSKDYKSSNFSDCKCRCQCQCTCQCTCTCTCPLIGVKGH